MKFNDFSMILELIWISMIFQELWKPWKYMKNYVTFSEAALKSAIAKNLLRISFDFAVF